MSGIVAEDKIVLGQVDTCKPYTCLQLHNICLLSSNSQDIHPYWNLFQIYFVYTKVCFVLKWIPFLIYAPNVILTMTKYSDFKREWL